MLKHMLVFSTMRRSVRTVAWVLVLLAQQLSVQVIDMRYQTPPNTSACSPVRYHSASLPQYTAKQKRITVPEDSPCRKSMQTDTQGLNRLTHKLARHGSVKSHLLMQFAQRHAMRCSFQPCQAAQVGLMCPVTARIWAIRQVTIPAVPIGMCNVVTGFPDNQQDP